MNKEGKSILKVGSLVKESYTTNKVLKLEENEQVIGIKAFTVRDPANRCHGSLYSLQFKIAKFI